MSVAFVIKLIINIAACVSEVSVRRNSVTLQCLYSASTVPIYVKVKEPKVGAKKLL